MIRIIIFISGVIICLLICLPIGFEACAANAQLDSLLQQQEIRAGGNGDRLFDILKMHLTSEELECAEFLLAYMPLADLASLSADFLLENIRLAIATRKSSPWGAQITDDLFKYFVLPHRVAQEPIQQWRRPFFEELSARVKGKSMTEAALEINLWCNEHATFEPTTPWDQGPLTTIKSGFGRCEEEMILTICALRSVGIPARPCHTPYWAHIDNNHAWVEVWADGHWYYLGGCEPDYELNHAWFDNPVRRAALVLNTAYGEYHGPEEVLKFNARSTVLNSTSIYTNSKRVVVKMLPNEYFPIAKQKVYFMLINYAGLLPLTSIETDSLGICALTSGLTDWVVWCGNGDTLDWTWVSAESEDTVLLKPKPIGDEDWVWLLDMHVPPPNDQKSESVVDEKVRDLWKERKICADKLRKQASEDCSDSMRIKSFSERLGFTFDEVASIMGRAKGNWEEVMKFLIDTTPEERELAKSLVRILDDKDLRTIDYEELSSHLSAKIYEPEKSDTISYNRFLEYVLQPRIGFEHLELWRNELAHAFKAVDVDKIPSIRGSNFVIEDLRDRLSPPLSPLVALVANHGTKEDLIHLIIAALRAKGVPARKHPITGKPQVWEGADWHNIQMPDDTVSTTAESIPGDEESCTLMLNYDGTAIPDPQCFTHWSLSRLEGGIYEMVDFEYLSPISSNAGPHRLPPGRYMLCGANRQQNGDVLAHLQFFTLDAGDSVLKTLVIREPETESTEMTVVIQPPDKLIPLSKWGASEKFKDFMDKNLLMLWAEPNIESTERVLADLSNINTTEYDDETQFVLITSDYPGVEFLDRMTKAEVGWSFYLDPSYAQLGAIISDSPQLQSPNEKPFLLVVDKNGRVLGYSAGLRFGVASQIQKWLTTGDAHTIRKQAIDPVPKEK